MSKSFVNNKNNAYLCTQKSNDGLMAERLGRGLQNLVQRFESASDLKKTALEITLTLFFFGFVIFVILLRKGDWARIM